MSNQFNNYGLTTKISWSKYVTSTPRSDTLYITYACFRNPLKWDFKRYVTYTYDECMVKHKECVEMLRYKPGILGWARETLIRIISILC